MESSFDPVTGLPESFEASRDYALRLDAKDPLASYRYEFVILEPDLIYLDGNSLGRLPRATLNRMGAAVQEEWGQALIRGWNRGWYQAPQRLGEQIARLVGAAPGQVMVCDSTSINLYKLAWGAMELRPGREVIVSDQLNFPSDLYILQGILKARRLPAERLRLAPSADGITPDQQALLDLIDEHTALVTLSHAAFKSGYLYDAAALTEYAHRKGALVLWDLSHSAGAVPIALDEWGADLAVGCSYKYLNGGPGAPAFLYVRKALQADLSSPIWGWFGERSPFAFELDYQSAEGMPRFLTGTPPVLSMLALEPALALVESAGIPRIRAKSILLTSYLVALADRLLAQLDFSLGSPRQPEQRGSHISLRHPQGYQINRALIEEMQVLPDFREPDNLRLGLSPLYTSFEEVWQGVTRLQQAVIEGRHLRYPAQRLGVT
jgi:kynureninase